MNFITIPNQYQPFGGSKATLTSFVFCDSFRDFCAMFFAMFFATFFATFLTTFFATFLNSQLPHCFSNSQLLYRALRKYCGKIARTVVICNIQTQCINSKSIDTLEKL